MASSSSNNSNSKEASALIISAAEKAGMQGIDRARIDAILLRESGNSRYMQQQRKRDGAVTKRIAALKRKHAETPFDAASEEALLRPELEALEKSRKRASTRVVVDMDAFYMACELLTRPDLREVPACVGRGMILTSNYAARKYGVRSAMAGWIGDALVRELSGGQKKLVHVPSNFGLYTEKAHVVRRVLADYDPNLRAYSLDECYLDLAPYLSLRIGTRLSHAQIAERLSKEASASSVSTPNASDAAPREDDDEVDDHDDDERPSAPEGCLEGLSPAAVAEAASGVVSEMRERVKEATGGLTCSAGIASNFMLAKIASDRNKPNGQCLVGASEDSIRAFLHPLSIRKVPGIGRVTEKILNAFGIHTVRQLYEERALVRSLFRGQATATFLLQRSIGWASHSSDEPGDDPNNSSTTGQKGISKERTFASGKPWAEVLIRLEEIARMLSDAMERKNLRARTVTVKCKLHTFDVLSRSKSVAAGQCLNTTEDLVPLAVRLLTELKAQHLASHAGAGTRFSVRLLGIRASSFLPPDSSKQSSISSFFAPPTTGQPNAPAATTVAIPRPKRAASPAPKAAHRSPSPLSSPAAAPAVVICPICSLAVPGNNDAVNRHIDACLNGNTIRTLVQDGHTAACKKPRRIQDFFSK